MEGGHLSKPVTLEEFIKRSDIANSNKYDYSLSVYIATNSKLQVICNEHGVFLIRPHDHMRGIGCPHCANRARLTTDEFVKRSKKVHGEKYDYTQAKYITSKTKIKIICNEHGSFEQTPNEHLSGKGCYSCGKKKASESRRLSFPELIEKCLEVHGETYKYHHTSPKLLRETISIVCDKHGAFEQKLNGHLLGKGCRKCGKEASGWSRSKFKALVERKGTGTLYVVKLSNEKETFLKIGITTRTVQHRSCDFPYAVEVLHEETFTDGELMFDLENHLHREFKNIRYIPFTEFAGCTECFELMNVEDIKSKIYKFINYYKV